MLVLVLIAFLLGSIPSGYFVARLHGIDIRQHGSGNIGATNVKRILGKKAGILTLLFDMIKGALAASLASYPLFSGTDAISEAAPILGFMGILGHCYSPFLKGKGGKGVATALAVYIVLSPIAALILVVMFAVVTCISRYVSAGSITAALLLPFTILLMEQTPSIPLMVVSILTTLLVLIKHRGNISRLKAGEENKIR